MIDSTGNQTQEPPPATPAEREVRVSTPEPGIRKREVELPDHRYLIYYEFARRAG